MNRITMLFPDGKTKAFTLSYDDGRISDIKMTDIIKKYRVKATVNLNSSLLGGNRYITSSDVRTLYDSEYFEVATHSCTHPFLDRLPAHEAFKEIINDRVALEALKGYIIRGHAYPFGTYNSEVINVLKTAGIAYARTVVSTREFKLPDSWYEWHPTCHHDDPELFALADKFLSQSISLDPPVFYVWGHSYEFDMKQNWSVLEQLLERVSGKEEVWYASNIEIHDYTEAFRGLIWSGDCSKVHNPGAIDVWLNVTEGIGTNTYIVMVKAGKTAELKLPTCPA
jgi:peptidoglycan/xylan/chitin deacetylase (PgdA/CDA1 family)